MNFFAEKGVTSYALDLPGHGERRLEGVIGLGIMDYVSAVESKASELSLTSPILVGHSMGGLIVQKYLEKNEATAAVLIAPCPAMGGSLRLLFKYAMRQPIAGLTATFGRRTAIRDKAMCRRLFFNHISPESLDSYFAKLCLESSKATRQIVLPFLKVKASKIKTTPVAVAAAGKDYFFEFEQLKNWSDEYGYDFLPFPEAAHNLLCEPEEYGFGKTIYEWLDQKVLT